MPGRATLAALLLLVGRPVLPLSPQVAAVVTRFEQLARKPLWPGFQPASTPLAIYDGSSTWLYHHPDPPPGFSPDSGSTGWERYPGLFPAVRANSYATVGGVTTATLLLDEPARHSDLEWAGVLLHETFHVFQAAHHPNWAANEADLFSYPMEAPAPQRLQRLETEAFRRALARPADAACWAREALELRSLRFGILPVPAVAYERGGELNEGLATFIQATATGLPSDTLPEFGFAPDAVRTRSYGTGNALAVLLDRFAPGWEARLEAGSTSSLDQMLREALGSGTTCRFSDREMQQVRRRTDQDETGLTRGREALRDSVLEAPGWRVEFTADSATPFQVQGFDPLNVEKVAPDQVVHRRFIQLQQGAASLEIMDHRSLSIAAGGHPLFSGVRRLIVTGLALRPSVSEGEHGLRVSAKGLMFEGPASLVERGDTLVVSLREGRD
jgi:hypothetical protein